MALRFLRSLMPREERFVDNFAAHAACMVAGARALTAMMQAHGPEREARFKEVCAIEGQADAIARETLVSLHKAFITPFDRSDIHSLSTALDDAVDLIEEVAQRAVLYRLETFSPRMLELAAMIENCAELLTQAIPLLHDVNRNVGTINSLCERVGRIESDADRLLRLALSELIAEGPSTIEFLGRKEVYELLETVTDRCDDVADLIEGILLDHV
jgi:predicted phosphate transport protein (TIGR00153 family)